MTLVSGNSRIQGHMPLRGSRIIPLSNWLCLFHVTAFRMKFFQHCSAHLAMQLFVTWIEISFSWCFLCPSTARVRVTESHQCLLFCVPVFVRWHEDAAVILRSRRSVCAPVWATSHCWDALLDTLCFSKFPFCWCLSENKLPNSTWNQFLFTQVSVGRLETAVARSPSKWWHF